MDDSFATDSSESSSELDLRNAMNDRRLEPAPEGILPPRSPFSKGADPEETSSKDPNAAESAERTEDADATASSQSEDTAVQEDRAQASQAPADRAKRQLSFGKDADATGADEDTEEQSAESQAPKSSEDRLMSSSQAEGSTEEEVVEKVGITRKGVLESLQSVKRPRQVKTPEKIPPSYAAQKTSPKLQALKARNAARRGVKHDLTKRPSSAPVRERPLPHPASHTKDSQLFNTKLRESMQKHVLPEDYLKDKVAQLSERLDVVEEERRAAMVEAEKLRKVESAMTKHYESLLEEKAVEIKSLGAQLEASEARTTKGMLQDESVTAVTLTEADLTAIRKEMQEQELLIKGYQMENESAVKRLKRMQAEFREKEERMAVDQGHIARELASIQEEKKRDSLKTASFLREKLELQKENNGLREELYQIELRFKADMERLRREKHEMEARAAGVDLPAMERDDREIKAMKVEMDAMRKEHGRIQQELEGKLRWYADNQELLSKNTAVIREQSDTIATLKQRLVSYEGHDQKGSPEQHMSKRIKELESEVTTLQDITAEKNPDSLSALIQASKPSLAESTRVKELEVQVAHLTTKNEEIMAKHEAHIISLRQKHERSRTLERDSRYNSKVKELSKQLEEVRTHYTKKIKTLEKAVTDAKKDRSAKPEPSRQRPPKREASTRASGCQTDDTPSVSVSGSSGGGAGAGAAATHAEAEIREERDQLRRELKLARETRSMQSDNISRLTEQIQELTAKFNAMQPKPTQPPQIAGPSVVGGGRGEAEAEGGYYGAKENAPGSQLVDRMRFLESEIVYLRGQSNYGRAPASSRSPEYLALEERVSQMDARQAAREEQWRSVMEETKHLANLQQETLKRKWELAIKAKNAEIDHFRTELNAILFDVSNLQRKDKRR